MSIPVFPQHCAGGRFATAGKSACRLKPFGASLMIRAMLGRMRALISTTVLTLVLTGSSYGQPALPSFEVASVRSSPREVGPDYNNQIVYSPEEFRGRNVTLRRLVAEAWGCQLKQVVGPRWLDQNEYEVDARIPTGVSPNQITLMLRSLLADRFGLKQHSETQQMRVYELAVGKNGPKIRPIEMAGSAAGKPGFHFHGGMREFADLLAVQFSIPAVESPTAPVTAGGPSIPVIDKTGLGGTYDFSVDIRPEPGTDAFTAWKRVLENQLGLKIDSRTSDVTILVVDDASRTPTEN